MDLQMNTYQTKKILEVEKVYKAFSNKEVISDINIFLEEGEIISLLGFSGVGKSTLFNIIAGVLQPDQGRVLLKDKDITNRPGHISYMLQKDLLLEQKTILMNVSLPLIIKGKSKKEAKEISQKYFEMFGLEGTEKAYPNQLSGGMRQRAAFLRTYLSSEDVILLDEPFSALDAITKKELHDWYKKMSQELGLSTIFISHDIDEAIYLSDRVYIMTGKPGIISSEVKIKRPKSGDFSLSSEFLIYKKDILDKLNR